MIHLLPDVLNSAEVGKHWNDESRKGEICGGAAGSANFLDEYVRFTLGNIVMLHSPEAGANREGYGRRKPNLARQWQHQQSRLADRAIA